MIDFVALSHPKPGEMFSNNIVIKWYIISVPNTQCVHTYTHIAAAFPHLMSSARGSWKKWQKPSSYLSPWLNSTVDFLLINQKQDDFV